MRTLPQLQKKRNSFIIYRFISANPIGETKDDKKTRRGKILDGKEKKEKILLSKNLMHIF